MVVEAVRLDVLNRRDNAVRVGVDAIVSCGLEWRATLELDDVYCGVWIEILAIDTPPYLREGDPLSPIIFFDITLIRETSIILNTVEFLMMRAFNHFCILFGAQLSYAGNSSILQTSPPSNAGPIGMRDLPLYLPTKHSLARS